MSQSIASVNPLNVEIKSYDQLNDLLKQLKEENPNILFTITRSKNFNVIAYEANWKADRSGLNPDQPIKVFWLSWAPELMKQAREQGKSTDREDISFVEATMAYGLSTERVVTCADEMYSFHLVACKTRKGFVRVKNDKTLECTLEVNGEQMNIVRIHIDSTDPVSFFGLPTGFPTVNFTDLVAVNAHNELITEHHVVQK